MAKRSVIRRINPSAVADFDEQSWPINCALLVLIGFATGVVIALSDFADPRILHNGWTRLAGLAITVLLLGWGMFRLRGVMQRRLQLAVLISVLLHLALAVYLHTEYLQFIARLNPDAETTFDDGVPVTMPDYFNENPSDDDPRQDFELPVETVTPDAEEQQVSREATETPESITDRPAAAEPNPSPEQTPSPVELERAEISAPRRAEELAGPELSRQAMPERSMPQDAIPQPLAPDSATEAASAIDAQVAALERQATDAETAPQTAAEMPREISEAESQAIDRNSVEPDPTASADSPALTRRETRIESRPEQLAVPNVEAAAESAAELAAAAVDVQRQSSLPDRRQATLEPAGSSSSEVAAATTRRASPRGEPRVDTNRESVAARDAADFAAPRSDEAGPALAAGESTAVASLEASRTTVDRSSTSPAASPNRDAAGDSAALSPRSPLARTAGAGRPSRADPAADAIGTAPSRAVGRQRGQVAIGDLASAEEAPAIVSGGAADMPTGAQPRTAAVARRGTGATQFARAENEGDDLPTPDAAGRIASAAARRSTAQQDSPGNDPSPGEPARVARAAAGGAVPSAAFRGEEVQIADRGGSDRPSDLEASSSAAASRTRAADLPSGPINAASGAAAVDTGTSEVVANLSTARSLGGGEVAGETSRPGPRIGRTSPGPAGAAGLALGEPEADALAAAGGAGTAGDAEGGRQGGGPSPSESATRITRRGDGGGTLPGRASGSPSSDGSRSPGELAAGGGSPDGGLASSSGAEPGGSGGSSTIETASGTPQRSDQLPTGLTAGSSAASIGAVTRSGAASIPAGLATAEDVGPVAGAAADEVGPTGLEASGVGAVTRRETGLAVNIPAPEGVGGLAPSPTADLGVPSRRAQPRSEVVSSLTGRFIVERSGGRLPFDASIHENPAPAFRQRNPAMREETARSSGGTEGTERAVELGLEFLARHQSPDGSWKLHAFAAGREGYENAGEGRMQADTAGTGLALLAFFGAGYTHLDGKHQEVVVRGLEFLLANQKPDGDLFTGGSKYAWLYSHGIASIALCESYGLTRDPRLREPAQHALDFIAAAQSTTDGGWRYSPGRGTDTSVSGWQLMAMKSGELAGLEIPSPVYEGVGRWLNVAQGSQAGSLYAYRPAAEQAHQREPSAAMTAEALLMRLYLGWERNDPRLAAGVEYLRDRLPRLGTRERPLRDAYYWYYATQVMFQVQGDAWQQWNDSLQGLLLPSQAQEGPLAGSWDPLGPIPDRWGPDGGRIYLTAMHLLMLEVYYRHLPLYKVLE